jgi:hypothetical protein
MAFGQQSGPPATAKQVQELLGLLQEAGHADFRDARGPLGFTQRQAAGKFTRDEADAFIEALQTAAQSGDGVAGGDAPTEQPAVQARRAVARPAVTTRAAPIAALHRVPTDQLAAELQRRGWIVVEP